MTNPTVEGLEQRIAAIDARRAAIAAERAELARRTVNVGVTSPAITHRLEALGREAAELLHRDRVGAQKQLRRLHERECDRRAVLASLEVAGAQRQLCQEIGNLAAELVSALQDERELHRQLVERAGRSRLPDLWPADDRFLDHLVRLSEIASINGSARRAGEQEQQAEVVA